MCWTCSTLDLFFFRFIPRRAVEVVESDERKKASDPKAESKGERCCDVNFVFGWLLFPTRQTWTLTRTLLVLCVRAVSRVSLPQVARVLSEVYGDRMASQCGSSDGESFPLQQKLLVCCLLLLIRNGKSKEIVLGKVRRWTHLCSCSRSHDSLMMASRRIGVCFF